MHQSQLRQPCRDGNIFILAEAGLEKNMSRMSYLPTWYSSQLLSREKGPTGKSLGVLAVEDAFMLGDSKLRAMNLRHASHRNVPYVLFSQSSDLII